MRYTSCMELEPEAAKRLVLAKTMGLEADELPPGSLEPYKWVFYFKINVGAVPSEDIPGYMKQATDVLSFAKDDLRARGIAQYFVPSRDEPTALSIINLETMVVGKL